MNKPLFLQDPAPYGVQELAAGNVLVQEEIFGGRKATGTITFTANPTAGHTITLNGEVWTAAAAADAPNKKFKVEADLSTTLDSLVALLNASVSAALSVATYSKSGTTILAISYDAESDAGNAYTLASGNANGVVSAATLTGGTTAQAIDNKFETSLLSTNAGTAQSWDLADGLEGQEKSLFFMTKGAGANALVRGNFLGGTTLTLDTAAKWAKLKFLNGLWRPIVNTGSIA